MPFHRLAFFINNEFGKIPFDETAQTIYARKLKSRKQCWTQKCFDLLSQSAGLLLLQILVQWMSFVTIHVNLFKKVKVHVLLFRVGANLFSITRFLQKSIFIEPYFIWSRTEFEITRNMTEVQVFKMWYAIYTWPANWLHGKARIRKPLSLYFSSSSTNWA